MRLPPEAHSSRPWRIHEVASDFQLLDVWALPTPGAEDDFPLLVDLVASADPAHGSSPVVRVLFAVRYQLGRLFGWDRPQAGVGKRVTSLRDRLPADLRDHELAEPSALPFEPLYRTNDEFAAEVANQTVHGILHLGWVRDGTGSYRGQMAILVKPNGLLGRAYLAAIMPFRHVLVYPALLREIEARWHAVLATR